MLNSLCCNFSIPFVLAFEEVECHDGSGKGDHDGDVGNLRSKTT